MLPEVLFALALQDTGQAACDLIRSGGLQHAGHDAMLKRQYDLAAQRYTEALGVCPQGRTILVDLARAQMQRRRFDDAIRLAREVADREPSWLPARLTLANAYFMAQRLPEALEHTQLALKLDPNDAAALKLKANIVYLQGDLEKAAAVLLTVMERYPNDEDAAYMLGRMYYQDGRIDHAMGLFKRVLAINPKSHKAYDNLGLCFESRGETDTAIRYFLTAIKLVETDYPEYDSAYANLASLLIDRGDAQQAFGAASKAADRNPYSARNFFIGGKALAKLGKDELAVNWLERSAALDANYPEPLYLLARLYAQLQQPEKARAAMQKFNDAKGRSQGQRR